MGGSCSVLGTAECRRCINADGGPPAVNARLLEAARQGDMEAMERSVTEGASVNAVDTHGWSALHYTAAAGQLEVCKFLLHHSSDVNSTLNDFSTPLMLAVEEGHLNVAKLLLSNGAMPWCKDETGFTAKDRCDKSIQTDVAQLLSQDRINAVKV
ncbi:unnamed protein product [Effrenium voratum]|uniref:Uncharacterized protein n=1 Tax=Effrenium voratum TaxID=2562239 RepID=A0AA36HN37_9DINO|nr:unnamed protein product [Effrenium voratum]